MSIKLLDENTINKIAAGEVIENPANVVKELVENSIDANSTHITVELLDGGIKLIKVIDDGDGFNESDIKIAFMQHATSKITKLEDLYEVESYGFRGEALSSIAAVANVTLITNDKTDGNGYKYNINYGKGGEIEKCASNRGTTFVVENLFENIPVRKKFLKSYSKESSNVIDIIIKMAMIHREISFKLLIDGNVKFVSSGDNDITSIIYSMYGKIIYDNLIYVENTIKDIHISGYIAKPQVVRNNRNDEIYFVNNRYVIDKIIRKAVEDAYSGYLMQHKFPLVVLNIEVNNSNVDVNVHPKKAEVRFADDDIIYYAIYNTIINKLKDMELIHIESFNESTSVEKENINVNIEESNDELYTYEGTTVESLPSMKSILNCEIPSGINVSNLLNKLSDKENEKVTEIPFIEKTLTENHKYIGQVFATYILVEYEEKLYIIDQHAAHEKINYEKIMSMYKNNSVMSQKIFPSIILHLTPIQYEAIVQNMKSFTKIGFEIETFGDRDVKIDAVPYNLFGICSEKLLIDMIDSFIDKNNNEKYDSIEEKIASISCKKAIKANHILTEIEVKNLLRELFKLDNPYNCPHGRPTIISLSKSEFEKKFGRIVQ